MKKLMFSLVFSTFALCFAQAQSCNPSNCPPECCTTSTPASCKTTSNCVKTDAKMSEKKAAVTKKSKNSLAQPTQQAVLTSENRNRKTTKAKQL
jgi:hypothetical protein